MEDFFHKRSNGEVKTLGLRRAWSFIVDESVGLSREEEDGDDGESKLLDILREWLDKPEEVVEDIDKSKSESQVDDAVFFSSYIPRSLGEVYDPERDVDLLRSGQGDKLIYASLTGLKLDDKKNMEEAGDKADKEEVGDATKEPAEAKVVSTPVPSAPEEPTPTEPSATETPAPEKKSVRWEDELSGEDDDDEEDEPDFERRSRGFRHEDKDAKKVSVCQTFAKLTVGAQKGFERGKPRKEEE